jgi:hypothetical protein
VSSSGSVSLASAVAASDALHAEGAAFSVAIGDFFDSHSRAATTPSSVTRRTSAIRTSPTRRSRGALLVSSQNLPHRVLLPEPPPALTRVGSRVERVVSHR